MTETQESSGLQADGPSPSHGLERALPMAVAAARQATAAYAAALRAEEDGQEEEPPGGSF